MGRGNGQGPSIEQMLEALTNGGGQRRPQSPEELRQAAIESFNEHLDHALNGTCPGNAEPEHAAVEQATHELMAALSSRSRHMLPGPVADAVTKVLAFEAMHHSEGMGTGFKAISAPEIFGLALLVAGAVLRVKDMPETQGIKLSTGLYA